MENNTENTNVTENTSVEATSAENKDSKKTHKYHTPSQTLINVLFALRGSKLGNEPKYSKGAFVRMMRRTKQFIDFKQGGLNKKGLAVFGRNEKVMKAAAAHRNTLASLVDTQAESSEAPVEEVVAEPTAA